MARTAKADKHSVMLCPPMFKNAKGKPDFHDKRISWPQFGSIKFNGNRQFCRAGKYLTRSMIPSRNKNIPAYLQDLTDYAKKHKLCFDMEVLDADADHLGGTTGTMNALDHNIPVSTVALIIDVISLKGWNEPGHTIDIPFRDRYAEYRDHVRNIQKLSKHPERYVAVKQEKLRDPEAAMKFFNDAVKMGEEGIITTHPASPYTKYRCTPGEAFRLKWKLEETLDAVVVGVQQGLIMRKGIKRTRNAWGRSEMPTKNDANYEKSDMVGALDVITEDGRETQITYAEGWDHIKRKALWKHQKDLSKSPIKFPVPSGSEQPTGPLIGQWVELKHIPHGEMEGGKVQSGRLVRFRPDKSGTKTPKVKK